MDEQSEEMKSQIMVYCVIQLIRRQKRITTHKTTVNNNQPLKVFVKQSKYVVVSAQKLVCIEETVDRNVKHNEIKSQVLKCSNSFCESLN